MCVRACVCGGGDGQALQGIWAEVLSLRVCEVASNVPFSEYGGDSLLGIEVLSLAARRHVPLGDAGALTANFEMLSIQDMVTHALRLRAAHTASDAAGGCKDAAASVSGGAVVILERSTEDPPGAPPTNVGGISACANGDLAGARGLRELRGWRAAKAVDKHGNTALMWAAGAGHLDVVKWLVEEEQVDVQASNKQGRTAVMWAAKNGRVAVLQWMLHQAPQPRADVGACMKDGSRAWDWAVYGGDGSTLALLVAHPDVDIHALNHFGCGAAFWAAASGDVRAPLLDAAADMPSPRACIP